MPVTGQAVFAAGLRQLFLQGIGHLIQVSKNTNLYVDGLAQITGVLSEARQASETVDFFFGGDKFRAEWNLLQIAGHDGLLVRERPLTVQEQGGIFCLRVHAQVASNRVLPMARNSPRVRAIGVFTTK